MGLDRKERDFLGGEFNEPSILRIKVDNARRLLGSLVAPGDSLCFLPVTGGLRLREMERLPRGGAGFRWERSDPQAFDFSLQRASPVWAAPTEHSFSGVVRTSAG